MASAPVLSAAAGRTPLPSVALSCASRSVQLFFRGRHTMCGIVGYVGRREAEPILVDGLRRLEYRGYDSAGVATIPGLGQIHLRRRAGRLGALTKSLRERPVPGCLGISH